MSVRFTSNRILLTILLSYLIAGCSSLAVPKVPFVGEKRESVPQSADEARAPAHQGDSPTSDSNTATQGASANVPAASLVPTPKLKSGSQALYDRALALIDSGDDAAAMEPLNKLSQVQPELAGPWINLGLIHRRSGDTEAARRAFEMALKANSSSCPAHNMLGVMAREHGLFQEAEAHYKRCLAVDPTYADAYLNLGILYELYLGQFGEALAAYNDYQLQMAEPDQRVTGWLLDLERRAGAVAQR